MALALREFFFLSELGAVGTHAHTHAHHHAGTRAKRLAQPVPWTGHVHARATTHSPPGELRRECRAPRRAASDT